MMEKDKNYVGKIIKVYYHAEGKEHSQTGIVLTQRTLSSGKPQMNMLLTDGREWLSTYVNVERITSARIDENLRSSLVQYFKAKVSHEAFLNAFWKEKIVHEQNVADALRAVRDFSGTMSHQEFFTAVEDLFKETFPREEDHSGWYKRYFHCCGGSQSQIEVAHVQDVEKYANPEKYSFIRREYDNQLFIEPDTPGFKQFCERNAPAKIQALNGKCKTEVSAGLGDKWLTVSRIYIFPLTNGYSKQSLNSLADLLRCPAKTKLSEQISSANQRKTVAEKHSTREDKKHNPVR